MGIGNLLPLLKPALKPVSLSEYKNKRVGVDGNLWIHRGAYTCAFELHVGEQTTAYVGYCCKLARLLLEHGVRPVIVFDGNSLGAKGETAAARAEGRRKACAELDRNIEEHRELQMRLEQAPHDTDLQYAVGAAKQLCDEPVWSSIGSRKEY